MILEESRNGESVLSRWMIIVKPILVAILIHFLGTCPIWCATYEVASIDACAHGAHAPGELPTTPAPTPVNDDCCVCNGGVATSAVEAVAAHQTPPDIPTPFDALLPNPGMIDAGTGPIWLVRWRSRSAPREHCAPSLADMQSFRC
jgi:hypothetical protein